MSSPFATKNSKFKFAHYQDQKASGTAGGSSIAGWQVRTLNTEVSDVHNIATLASNEVTPVAGKYILYATAPGYNANRHRIAILEDSVEVEIGGNQFATGACTDGIVWTYIDTDGTKAYSIEHRIDNAQLTNGLGLKLTLTGKVEVYANLYLLKIG